jgi:glycosyltransferase involved in cell wall biosynthesis
MSLSTTRAADTHVMKILCISNLYPPQVLGGYEALCHEVVEALTNRGHDVTVLTSPGDATACGAEERVHRILPLEGNFDYYKAHSAWLYPLRKAHAIRQLRRLVREINPDVAMVWNLWNMSKSFAQETERLLGNHVLYYIASPWPVQGNVHRLYWDLPATSPIRTTAKRGLRAVARVVLRSEWNNVPLQLKHAPCCSQAQRNELTRAGLELRDAPVVYEGIDLHEYLAQARSRASVVQGGELRCLFVGILAEHKGVHTAVEALSHLAASYRERVSLTIVGEGHPKYENRLQELVASLALCERITFQPRIPRHELPKLLGRFDVLLLPSVWPEPLARIMQEGMAAGMVVVASSTGGTIEAISHLRTGLLFRAGDARALAGQLAALVDDAPLRQRLASAARRKAAAMFDLGRMVDELEDYLERISAPA